MALDTAFLARPIAHRGLHDAARGIPENSAAAFRAAVAADYGIELDLQLSSDGQAMVFHDRDFDRMTDQRGPVSGRTAADADAIRLQGGSQKIPRLTEILEMVAGRVPLLIEMKDQSGSLGPGPARLETALAGALARYSGPVAVMSFNPETVGNFTRLAPEIPVGLVTGPFRPGDWPDVPRPRLERLQRAAALGGLKGCFISHDHRDLDRPLVAGLRSSGLPVLCWTVRSAAQERRARKFADNITFEGYLP